MIGGSSKCSPFSEYWRKDSSEIKMSVGKYRLALHECAERNEVQYIWLAYFQPITSTDHASAVIFRGECSVTKYIFFPRTGKEVSLIKYWLSYFKELKIK